ncbi:MAG: type II toxin-antitoxin system RelE/ParE family toxin [Candidatus Sumerlaeota bacterium]|nr:type II toxin-antitoxin system RelE/ParE family toxin [Candidatus Sumerlaeota bacterium]
MAYAIEFAKSAAKQLATLPGDARRRISLRITALAANPRPPGAVKLEGVADTYRFRVGAYRVIYEVQDKRLLIYVLRVAHRKIVYRGF